MHLIAPPADCAAAGPSGHRARLNAHLVCDHLHDRDHVRHLCVAGMVCTVNLVMVFTVPSLSLQLLVTVFFFGRDALSILAE